MKKNKTISVKPLYSFMLLVWILSSVTQAKEYKVVFDCSSSDAHYIKSRMWLIGKTMDMIEAQGDTVSSALTLHGSCVAMVSKDYDMIVADEDVDAIKKAQNYLKVLAKRKNMTITVCEMSLASNAIEKEEVLDFINISKNSFIDTIRYQNNGYALMSFK